MILVGSSPPSDLTQKLKEGPKDGDITMTGTGNPRIKKGTGRAT